MPTFIRWNKEAKSEGEPVLIEHQNVASVSELRLTAANGSQRHGSRVHMNDGDPIDLAVPAGEVQDRLNDCIASAPTVEDVMPAESEPVAQDPFAFSSTDQNDDDDGSAHDPRTEDTDG